MIKHPVDYTMNVSMMKALHILYEFVCRITTYPEFSAFRHSEKYLIKITVFVIVFLYYFWIVNVWFDIMT